MKKIAIATFVLLTLVGCGKEIDISQKQVRKGIVYTINEDKPFTGKVVGKYENGQIKEKITYQGGVPTGVYNEYHKNGEVAYTGSFSNGKKEGEWNRYTEDKKLILTEIYKNEKLEDVKQFLIDTDKIKGKINSLFN